MRRIVLCLCLVLGLAAITIPTINCGGGGGGGTPVTGSPILIGPIQWIDVDNSGTINASDRLILCFDRAITFAAASTPATDLAVTGAGTLVAGTFVAGPGGTKLTAILGAGSGLTPGKFGVVDTLNVIAASTLTNPNDGTVATPAATARNIMYRVHDSGQSIGSGTSQAAEIFNSDADAPLEILIGRSGTNQSFQSTVAGIYLGAATPTGDPGFNTRGIAVAELNGLFGPDFITANGGAAGMRTNNVYLNDMAGGFTHTPTPATRQLGDEDSNDVGVAQWDAALGLDAVFANNGTNYMYFSDGAGNFDGNIAATDMTEGMMAGAIVGTQNRRTVPGGANNTTALLVQEVGNGGLIDFFTGDDMGGAAGLVRLWSMTTGGGGLPPLFAATTITGTLPMPRAILLCDVDGDALLDLIVGYAAGNGMQLWLATAAGVFPAAPTMTFTGGSVFALACMDVNADGRLDVIQGRGNNQPDKVFLNCGVAPWLVDSGLNLGTTSTMDLAIAPAATGVDLRAVNDIASATNSPNVLWVTGQP